MPAGIEDRMWCPLNPSGDEPSGTGSSYPRKGPPVKPLHRINSEDAGSSETAEVVRNKHGSVMHDNDLVEIVEYEEPREPETRPPEWIGNPAIQIIVIRRWSIVGHDRRTLIRIVGVYCRRVWVISTILSLAGLSIGIRFDRYGKLGDNLPVGIQGIISCD